MDTDTPTHNNTTANTPVAPTVEQLAAARAMLADHFSSDRVPPGVRPDRTSAEAMVANAPDERVVEVAGLLFAGGWAEFVAGLPTETRPGASPVDGEPVAAARGRDLAAQPASTPGAGTPAHEHRQVTAAAEHNQHVSGDRGTSAETSPGIETPRGAAPRASSAGSEPARRRSVRAIETVATGGVVALMGALGVAGAVVSYTTVAELMEPSFGSLAPVVPLAVDAGILAVTGIDLLQARHHHRTKWMRFVSWGLVGLTSWMNAAAANSPLAAAAHIGVPALWVVAVEGAGHSIRHFAGLAAKGRESMDGIRLSRWLWAPVQTAKVARRRSMWEVTDYREALNQEKARDLRRCDLQERYGTVAWRWKRQARRDRVAYRHGDLTPPAPSESPDAAVPLAAKVSVVPERASKPPVASTPATLAGGKPLATRRITDAAPAPTPRVDTQPAPAPASAPPGATAVKRARPAKVTSADRGKQPGVSGASRRSVVDEEVLRVGRQARDELVSAGEPVVRRTLKPKLEELGHPVRANQKLDAILGQLREEDPSIRPAKPPAKAPGAKKKPAADQSSSRTGRSQRARGATGSKATITPATSPTSSLDAAPPVSAPPPAETGTGAVASSAGGDVRARLAAYAKAPAPAGRSSVTDPSSQLRIPGLPGRSH